MPSPTQLVYGLGGGALRATQFALWVRWEDTFEKWICKFVKWEDAVANRFANSGTGRLKSVKKHTFLYKNSGFCKSICKFNLPPHEFANRFATDVLPTIRLANLFSHSDPQHHL